MKKTIAALACAALWPIAHAATVAAPVAKDAAEAGDSSDLAAWALLFGALAIVAGGAARKRNRILPPGDRREP